MQGPAWKKERLSELARCQIKGEASLPYVEAHGCFSILAGTVMCIEFDHSLTSPAVPLPARTPASNSSAGRSGPAWHPDELLGSIGISWCLGTEYNRTHRFYKKSQHFKRLVCLCFLPWQVPQHFKAVRWRPSSMSGSPGLPLRRAVGFRSPAQVRFIGNTSAEGHTTYVIKAELENVRKGLELPGIEVSIASMLHNS